MKIESTLDKKNKDMAVVSWTGGKDSCFACYKAISEGFEVSYLLSFRDMKRRGAHEINSGLLDSQSEVIGIPILHIDFKSYEQEFKKVICNLNKRDAGIKGLIFGHIETHKNLVDRICRDLGIKPILPLWNRDSEQIMKEFLEAGFEAIIVSAKANLFDREWLGRKIDKTFVRELRSYNKSIDPCGENGEFHTLVIDGPMFRKRLRIVKSSKIRKEGLWFLDISKHVIEEKCNKLIY